MAKDNKLDGALLDFKLNRLTLLILLIFSVYGLYVIWQPFLTSLAWALFLSTAVYPVHLKFLHWLRGKEWFASIVTTLLLTSIVVVPSIFVASSIVNTTQDFIPSLQEKLKGAVHQATTAPSNVPPNQEVGIKQKVTNAVRTYISKSEGDVKGLLFQLFEKVGKTIALHGGAILQNVLRVLFNLVVMLILMVFLLRHTKLLTQILADLIPLPKDDKNEVLLRFKNVLEAVFFGVFLTAFIQAILGAIGWWISGLYSPFLFGFLMFFCALIPAVGTALVWLPGAAYLFWSGKTGMGIFLIVWGILAVGMVDNFLKPIFISGKAKIPMILVVFSIAGGISAFGITGLFLGPVIMTSFLFILEVFQKSLEKGPA